MTTAADLRADSLAEFQAGSGLAITLVQPAAAPVYDPRTGSNTAAAGDPVSVPGWGRISRFSDALAAGQAIENADSLIVWTPEDPTKAPVIDGTLQVTLAGGATQTFRVISWTPRYLGNDVVHYRIQGRR